jgi:hypothetical protein
MKWFRKLRMRLYLITQPKDSVIHVDTKREFYAIHYSDLKKWVIKDGDYLLDNITK